MNNDKKSGDNVANKDLEMALSTKGCAIVLRTAQETM